MKRTPEKGCTAQERSEMRAEKMTAAQEPSEMRAEKKMVVGDGPYAAQLPGQILRATYVTGS